VIDKQSEALILFLGLGITPHPKRDPERVLAKFGDGVGLDLVAYSQAVLTELYNEQPDWNTENLAEATERAVDKVRASHPELSGDAIEALRWSYSWDWK
jgi:hypothetical protein